MGPKSVTLHYRWLTGRQGAAHHLAGMKAQYPVALWTLSGKRRRHCDSGSLRRLEQGQLRWRRQ